MDILLRRVPVAEYRGSIPRRRIRGGFVYELAHAAPADPGIPRARVTAAAACQRFVDTEPDGVLTQRTLLPAQVCFAIPGRATEAVAAALLRACAPSDAPLPVVIPEHLPRRQYLLDLTTDDVSIDATWMAALVQHPSVWAVKFFGAGAHRMLRALDAKLAAMPMYSFSAAIGAGVGERLPPRMVLASEMYDRAIAAEGGGIRGPAPPVVVPHVSIRVIHMSADAAQRDDLGDRAYLYDHEGDAVPVQPEDLALAFATAPAALPASAVDAVNICELRRTCVRINSLNVGETGRFAQLKHNQDVQTRLAADNPTQPPLLMRVVAFRDTDIYTMPQSLVTESCVVLFLHDDSPIETDDVQAWLEQIHPNVDVIIVVVTDHLDEGAAGGLLPLASIVYGIQKQTYDNTPMSKILYEIAFGDPEPGTSLLHVVAGAAPAIARSIYLADRDLYAVDALYKAWHLRGILDASIVRNILGNYGIDGVTWRITEILRAFGLAFTDAGALFLLDDEYAVCQILFSGKVVTPHRRIQWAVRGELFVAVSRIFTAAYPAMDSNEVDTFVWHMARKLEVYAGWATDEMEEE